MFLLGFDIGSSSVKVSLIDGETGQIKHRLLPKQEMAIHAVQVGQNNIRLGQTSNRLARSIIVISGIGNRYQSNWYFVSNTWWWL